MSNSINAILQELKDTMSDPETVEKESKSKPKKKQADPSMPFSDKELAELNRELLHHDTAYKEPLFVKKTNNPTKLIPEVKTPVVQFDTSAILHSLSGIKKTLNRLDKRVEVNSYTEKANTLKIEESPQPLEIVKLIIAETGANENARYQLQTKEGIKEISLSTYYDMSKFVSMLQQYQYSMMIDKTITFENDLFNRYRDHLLIISQNMLANSFRFFEKNKILNETIVLGREIKEECAFTKKALDMLEVLFADMINALQLCEYQKDFYFAKLLNEKGFILNAITIIDEMLGEYIVESAQLLSAVAQTRIQRYLDKIEFTRSSRKAFYVLYKSAKDFFVSHFSEQKELQQTSFFPFKDSGNYEIETEMMKMYTANKMNKSKLFISYSELIERVRLIRNDLAHGNSARVYSDITKEISEVLVDFEYLAIGKNFLQS